MRAHRALITAATVIGGLGLLGDLAYRLAVPGSDDIGGSLFWGGLGVLPVFVVAVWLVRRRPDHPQARRLLVLATALAVGVGIEGPLAAELLESPQSWWVPWVNLLGQYTDTGALVAASLLLASYPDGTVEHHPLAPQAASQPPQAVRPRQFPSANPDRQPDGTPGGNPIRAIHRAQLKPTRGPPTRAPRD